jgi:squalene-hopene/tetraprenyl-beta-curcumene cyclase
VTTTPVEIEPVLARARAALLALRNEAGHWRGQLSASALSTATAVCALETAVREAARRGATDFLPRAPGTLLEMAGKGRAWLRATQSKDGGFGDTVTSPSNVSTTTLCWASLSASSEWRSDNRETIARIESWLEKEAGGLDRESLARTISERYGIDRTFSVPILTLCAVAGRFGEGPEAWHGFPALPFELAALPRSLFAVIGLPVVSYALPALIAIGLAQHRGRPTRFGPRRWLRDRLATRTLDLLEEIQPSSGGFLEATPLTSFVTLSLASAGRVDHPVTRKAIEFLARSMTDDGSWPIDTDLATWVTTLSVNALSTGRGLESGLDEGAVRRILDFVLASQWREVHPYTLARPGGWAWTDLPGGVPDGDDTPGALLALHKLALCAGVAPDRIVESARAGIGWLLRIQNRDGGMPTFCRGWGKLPFDRSSPDLTAHALRAFSVWKETLEPASGRRVARAMRRALAYLEGAQRDDGSWVPLWFGNQDAPRQENPLYGTSRVLMALAESRVGATKPLSRKAVEKGVAWILGAQGATGGFGGAPGVEPSLEETALAVEALSTVALSRPRGAGRDLLVRSVTRGVVWLVERTDSGRSFPASPIGLYFARLWYDEKLYPLIFTVSALGRAHALLGGGQS